MKKQTILIGMLCLISLLMLSACSTENNTVTNAQNDDEASESGELYISYTDDAANMGAVTSVEMEVSGVQVYSETQGWVTVSSASQTYSLLELKEEGRVALHGMAELMADTYTKAKFDVESVTIVNAEGSHEATIPKSTYEFDVESEVEANTKSSIVLDVIADESLHVSENGEYVFAAVVEAESKKNVDVDASAKSDVKINGGSTVSNVKVGMDISGNVGVGVSIDANSAITISDGNVIATLGANGVTNIEVDLGDVAMSDDFCPAGEVFEYAEAEAETQATVIGLTTYKGKEFCKAEGSTSMETPVGTMTTSYTYYFDNGINELWVITSTSGIGAATTSEIHIVDGEVQ